MAVQIDVSIYTYDSLRDTTDRYWRYNMSSDRYDMEASLLNIAF